MLSSSLAIFRYEFKKSFSLGPTFLWLCVIAFPTLLQLLIDQVGSGIPAEFSGALLVGTIPGAVCLLTILSTMSPYLNAELEGNTWPYIAVRPFGRTAMMLGKYLVSVTRSIMAGFLAIALVFPSTSLNEINRDVPLPITMVASQSAAETNQAEWKEENGTDAATIEIEHDDPYPLWLALAILVVLSSLCYSTLFCLLGTIMYKKPMILSIIYTLVVEGVISMLPAVVNAFTINFYLRSIFLRLMGWELSELPSTLSFLNDPNMISQMSTFWDLISLTILSVIFIVIANALLRNREYHVGETL